MDRIGFKYTLSGELREKLKGLTSPQRRGIEMILWAEAVGVAPTRLLKTPYSCRHCGKQVGRGGTASKVRKTELEKHELDCGESHNDWIFMCTVSSYYNKWLKNLQFTECLDLALTEFRNYALSEAVNTLKYAAAPAARELARQITEGEKDTDRRLAAIAVLDRADVTTADKPPADAKLEVWLKRLKEADE